MLKALLAGAFFSLATVAHAEPVAVLTKPSQTVNVSADAAQMTVYFTPVGEMFDVTMLFMDPDGDLLRSRIRLSDSQSHEVTLTDEDHGKRSRFRIERAGKMIGVHVQETDRVARLASGAVQARSNVK